MIYAHRTAAGEKLEEKVDKMFKLQECLATLLLEVKEDASTSETLLAFLCCQELIMQASHVGAHDDHSWARHLGDAEFTSKEAHSILGYMAMAERRCWICRRRPRQRPGSALR